MFKSNLNGISSIRNKSEKQKGALENIKLLYKLREGVIKLFNDYSSIISDAKYKTIDGKGIPNMVPKVSNRKAFDHSNLNILSPKQMLQRLSIALPQVIVANTSENLRKEIRQIIYSLCRAKKITKKAYNKIMNSIKKVIKQNEF